MNNAHKESPSTERLQAAPKGRFGLQLFVVTVIILLGLGLCVPAFNVVAERSPVMQCSANGRMIMIALKAWAGDHDGRYPEGPTANDAFRQLFVGEYVEDERSFTSPLSPYHGDDNIGTAPDFRLALQAGENHWAMTRGLNDSSNGNAPLVFENPVTATWPPRWNADAANQPKPGRCWKSGRVVIGRNDGSIAAEKLADVKGTSVPLAPLMGGKDLFGLLPEGQVMDIQR